MTTLSPMHPLRVSDVDAFWGLTRSEKIKFLEAYTRIDAFQWTHPRPTICIGNNDEKMFSFFLEKLMGRTPSIIGVFDPSHPSGETTPFYSFAARHVPNHELQYFKVYRALHELKMLKKIYPNLLIVDFAQNGWSVFLRAHLESDGFEVVDFTFYELVTNLDSVYEPWQEYWTKTKNNFDRFIKLEEQLDDPVSKKTLLAHLGFALSGDRAFLRRYMAPFEVVYRSFRPNGFSGQDIIVDAGAAHGDSLIDILRYAHDGLPEFICFEPDPGNFRKLKILRQRLQSMKITLHRAAVGEGVGDMSFAAQGDQTSHLELSNDPRAVSTVKVVRLDDVVEKCTFVKMDIEGAEPAALRGAQKLFATSRPEAAICTYHYALDLLDCADAITGMELNYKLNLRRHSPYLYELLLYANPV